VDEPLNNKITIFISDKLDTFVCQTVKFVAIVLKNEEDTKAAI
ncbi:2350_t:CDS:2, partial [Dentiscutata heterogama]